MGRSIGRCRCNRLFLGSLLIHRVSELGCVLRRLLYWALRRLIFSLTVEIWRSFRIVSFGTYQGASIIVRKVFLLEAFENFYVRSKCDAPELYAVGPDGFECRLINKYFVVGR
jgi:hypothetical protein